MVEQQTTETSEAKYKSVKEAKPYVYRYTPRWVQALSFTLFTVFLLIGIATIIIIQGNTININDGNIVSSGSIRIKSNVNGFEAYLNDEQRNIVNRQVNAVPEGEYLLRVEKEDYIPFETIVKVNGGLITSVQVQLFLETAEETNVFSGSINKSFFSENGAFVYAFNNTELVRRSFDNSLFSILESDTKTLLEAESELFNIAYNSQAFLASLGNERVLIEANNKLHVISAETNSTNLNLEEVLINPPYPFNKITWLDDNSLIFSSEELLYQFNVTNQESSIIGFREDTEVSYFVDQQNKTVYFLNNNEIYRYRNGTSQRILLNSSEDPLEYTSIYYANEDFILANNGESLIIVYTEFNEIFTVSDFFPFNVALDGKTLIGLNNTNEVVIIQFTPQVTQDIIEINVFDAPELANIDTKSITWAPNSSFFTFQYSNDNTKIYTSDPQSNVITELYSSDENILKPQTIISGDNESIIISIQETRPDNEVSERVVRLQIE